MTVAAAAACAVLRLTDEILVLDCGNRFNVSRVIQALPYMAASGRALEIGFEAGSAPKQVSPDGNQLLRSQYNIINPTRREDPCSPSH